MIYYALTCYKVLVRDKVIQQDVMLPDLSLHDALQFAERMCRSLPDLGNEVYLKVYIGNLQLVGSVLMRRTQLNDKPKEQFPHYEKDLHKLITTLPKRVDGMPASGDQLCAYLREISGLLLKYAIGQFPVELSKRLLDIDDRLADVRQSIRTCSGSADVYVEGSQPDPLAWERQLVGLSEIFRRMFIERFG